MVVARRFGLGTLVAVLLLSMAFLTPGGATAQSVSIEPGAAAAGTTVTATGSDWPPGISVRVEWADGTLLDEVVVDDSGDFSVELMVPAAAAPGEYDVRFIGFVPPHVPDCTVDVVEVTFTVLPAGVTPTPDTATATATAAATEPVSPTIVATQCATATGTPGTTETATGTSTTTAVVTGTAVTETPTSTATVTSTATSTAMATATRTLTATAIRTPTTAPTKTPTKVGYPGTGSAGLLDQDDDDGGSSVPLMLAIVVLGAGLTSTGVIVLRKRMA